MNDEEVKFKKLRGKIISKYGSLKAFYDTAKISPTSGSLKLTGQRGFTASDMREWGGELEISPEEYGLYFFD